MGNTTALWLLLSPFIIIVSMWAGIELVAYSIFRGGNVSRLFATDAPRRSRVFKMAILCYVPALGYFVAGAVSGPLWWLVMVGCISLTVIRAIYEFGHLVGSLRAHRMHPIHSGQLWYSRVLPSEEYPGYRLIRLVDACGQPERYVVPANLFQELEIDREYRVLSAPCMPDRTGGLLDVVLVAIPVRRKRAN